MQCPTCHLGVDSPGPLGRSVFNLDFVDYLDHAGNMLTTVEAQLLLVERADAAAQLDRAVTRRYGDTPQRRNILLGKEDSGSSFQIAISSLNRRVECRHNP